MDSNKRIFHLNLDDKFQLISLDKFGKHKEINNFLFEGQNKISEKNYFRISQHKLNDHIDKLHILNRFLLFKSVCISIAIHDNRLLLTSNDILSIQSYQLLTKMENYASRDYSTICQKEVLVEICTPLIDEVVENFSNKISNVLDFLFYHDLDYSSAEKLYNLFIKWKDIKNVQEKAELFTDLISELNVIKNYSAECLQSSGIEAEDFSFISFIKEASYFIEMLLDPEKIINDSWYQICSLISKGRYSVIFINPVCLLRKTCISRKESIKCNSCTERQYRGLNENLDCKLIFCKFGSLACNNCKENYFIHSEMKKLTYFLYKENQNNHKFNKLTCFDVSLATSRLCCFSCNSAICSCVDKEGNKLFKTFGTHGVIHKGWIDPWLGISNNGEQFSNSLIESFAERFRLIIEKTISKIQTEKLSQEFIQQII